MIVPLLAGCAKTMAVSIGVMSGVEGFVMFIHLRIASMNNANNCKYTFTSVNVGLSGAVKAENRRSSQRPRFSPLPVLSPYAY